MKGNHCITLAYHIVQRFAFVKLDLDLSRNAGKRLPNSYWKIHKKTWTKLTR
jgi:hypothetical protein